MFLNKHLRQAEKEITSNPFLTDSEGDAIISVKASDSEQIFSTFSFDCNDKINPELDEYIWDKAKLVPVNKDIKLKIYTEKTANKEEIKTALKNNYKKEYVETKTQIKRSLIFSFVMLLLGLAFLTVLLLMHKFFYNQFLEVVIEIATWVFIWEAVDSFFLQRAELKRKQLRLLKLYTAEIEIIKLKNIDKLD